MYMKQLKERRKELGLTQEALAERLNNYGLSVSREAVAGWELGNYRIPIGDPHAIEALAKALQVSVQEILSWYGYNFDSNDDDQVLQAESLFNKMTPGQRKRALKILRILVEG